jgi:hypothetical protein
MNAVTHGLRCQTIEPEHQRPLIDARVAEWADDLKPVGPAQAWMVRRAVAASVRLDLCLEAEVERREAAADRAEARHVAEARRKVSVLSTALPHRPLQTVEALESTAFGCDSLLAEFAALAGEVADPDGYLGKAERERALRMWGVDPRRPDPGHPVAGPFVRAALANDPDPDADEVDAWTGLDTRALGDLAARRAKHAGALPTAERGRLRCLELLAERMRALEEARAERWEEADGPAIEAIRRRAMLGSVGTKAAERLRRYESGHALDLHRALNALAKLRKDADARPGDAEAWSMPGTPAPNEPNPAGPEPEPEAPAEPADAPGAPAPNEPNPAGWGDANPGGGSTFVDAPGPIPPPRAVLGAAPEPPGGPVAGA